MQTRMRVFAVRNCNKHRCECVQLYVVLFERTYTFSLTPLPTSSPYSNELAELNLRANTIQLWMCDILFHFIYHSFTFHLTRARAENPHFVERVCPLDR